MIVFPLHRTATDFGEFEAVREFCPCILDGNFAC